MKLFNYRLAIGFILLMISCSSPIQDNYEIKGVELNAGAPWTANPETSQGIQNMQELLNDFTDKENIHAYHGLKEQLNKEFNDIFRNCTMTGPAHDQLHNYLYPLKGLFNDLSAEDLTTCKRAFSHLEQHLEGYRAYFN